MTETEQPLYPKVSSIYNKIMQLAIAIVIIVILMNLWFFSYEQSQRSFNQHFRLISQQYLSQIASGSKLLLADKQLKLQQFIDDMAKPAWVKDVSFYDETGQLLLASNQQNSINDLFGISQFKANKSSQYTPFIEEIRQNNSLKGYLRLTVEGKALTKNISQTTAQQYDLMRLMMLLAGVVGFLLTRGLNRFSRRGFRLSK